MLGSNLRCAGEAGCNNLFAANDSCNAVFYVSQATAVALIDGDADLCLIDDDDGRAIFAPGIDRTR